MEAQRRGKNVALAGAVLQAVFSGVLLFLWLWTDALTALTAALALGGGVLVWVMTAFLFYCRQLARQERIEAEEFEARGAGDASIFTDADSETQPAAARLAFVERWTLPGFTLLWAAYHATVGILLLRHVTGLSAGPAMDNAGAAGLFTALVVFAAFLFSRYATGMARQSQWRPLRAPGSYLLANVLFVIGAGGALLAAWQGYGQADLVIAYVVPILQVVLAVELLLNFVLDIYRPRTAGEEYRLAYDSRMLNLLAEPERVGHSIAETLNYQFGFEVSKTWFYQLLSRALAPLIVLGVVIMFAMSSIVIVRSGEKVVVLRWGRADREHRTLDAGFHLKWPWPVDTTHRFNVDKVHEIWLGTGKERSAQEMEGQVVNGKRLYLWTEDHGRREELDFVIAIPPRERDDQRAQDEKRHPFNVIKLVVLVQYKIGPTKDDLYNYGFQYTDPGGVLEAVAYREMVRYCASATLDEESLADDAPTTRPAAERAEAIMTSGRQKAADRLKQRVQTEADQLKLGVKITYVGLMAVHPPKDAAPEYEKVLEAERRRDEKRFEAEGEAKNMLAEMAGSPSAALRLAWAIRVQEDLEALASAKDRLGKAEELLRAVAHDLDRANEEIRLARLLGRIRTEDKDAGLQRLRDEYAVHRARLVDIWLATLGKAPGAAGRDRLLKECEVPAAVLDARLAQEGGIRPFDFPAAVLAAREFTAERLRRAAGHPAELLAQAEAERWTAELTERVRYESLRGQRQAWQANPYVYQWDRWLDVWDEVLPGMTKYILGVDKDRVEIWLDWERKSEHMGGTYDSGPMTEKPPKGGD